MFLVNQPVKQLLRDEYEGLDLLHLTKSAEKIKYYSTESYFREGMSDAVEMLGDDILKILHMYSVIVFKPDAIVGRRVHRALEFLNQHGFMPVHAFRQRFDRLSLREDWRYQLNQLTIDRMRLNTILADIGDALFVVLRDDHPGRTVPASVRLQMMKGPSFPDRQTPEHLRYVLGSWSRLLKFIHTPDEPADIIRELGIFLNPEQRRDLWELIRDSANTDGAGVAEIVEQIYQETPEHELDLNISIDRILTDLKARSNLSAERGQLYERMNQTIELCKSGHFLNWRTLEKEMKRNNIAVSWDYIVLGAAFIHNSYEKEVALVTNDGVQGWLSDNTGFVR